MDEQPTTMQIDDNFLDSIGLGSLSPEDKQALLLQIQDELQIRVGTALAQHLTEDQLDDFTEVIEGGDQQAAAHWLQENCPGYENVVREEVVHVRQELTENREAILQGVSTGGDNTPEQ